MRRPWSIREYRSRNCYRAKKQRVCSRRGWSVGCSCRRHGEARIYPQIWTEFRNSHKFTDCTIECSDRNLFRAHRLILATAGDYFRAALTHPLSSSASHLNVPYPGSVVKILLDFAYTGHAEIGPHNVEALLPAADHLGITALVELCARFLQSQMTAENAWGIHVFAKVYFCTRLAREARAFVLAHFEDFVADGHEFLSLSVEDLVSLARDDYLNVSGEEKLLLALNGWILHDLEARGRLAMELFECVRFVAVPEVYLREWLVYLPYRANISNSLVEEGQAAVEERQRNRDVLMDQCRGYMYRPRVPYTILFAAGGWNSGLPTNVIETYDIRSNRWLLSDCYEPTPRSYHGLVSVNNLLFMIGGFDGTVHFNTVRAFNPVTKEWTDRACMNSPRCYVSCVVLCGEIYAIGGYNGRSRMSSVEKYNVSLNQWSMMEPMNSKRSDAGAVVVDSKIYVAGGFNGHEVLNSVEMYDLATNRWTLVNNLGSPRSGVSLCYFRGFVYAIGGFNGITRLSTCERLNLERPWEWREDIPEMISHRSNFSCAVIEDKIIVVGGFNGSTTCHLTEMYDGSSWHAACPMNIKRSALSVCLCTGIPNAVEYSLVSRILEGAISSSEAFSE